MCTTRFLSIIMQYSEKIHRSHFLYVKVHTQVGEYNLPPPSPKIYKLCFSFLIDKITSSNIVIFYLNSSLFPIEKKFLDKIARTMLFETYTSIVHDNSLGI